MKIFYITNVILDERAVQTVHIDEVCKNIAALGHEVTLYAPITKKFKQNSLYDTKFINSGSWLKLLVYQINLTYKIWRDIKKSGPDLIYCRQDQFLIVPAIVARFFKVSFILEVNGRLIEEAKQINKSLPYKFFISFKIFELIEFFNIKSASGIVVVSDGIRRYLLDKYKISPALVKVITNGVDVGIFKPIQSLSSRNEIGLQSGNFYIGYIGSLNSWQGLRYVAEAANLLYNENTKVKFFIIGDGGDFDYLHEFIESNSLQSFIELRHGISHEKIPKYINAMDICLSYPLKIRGGAASPFKVYEYLACGKTVIVSDIGGIKEEFGEVVIYTVAESAESLARTITGLMNNPDIREQMGKIGREFIEKDHSWKSVAEKISLFCEQIKQGIV